MPNKKKEDIEINKAIAKYQISNDRNIMESQAQWNRASSMLVFNSILITSIVLSYQDNSNLPLFISFSLPIIGLIICGVWYSMNARGFMWIHHWIDSAREIEHKYLKSNKLKFNPILAGKDLKEKEEPLLNSESATNVLILMIVILYLIFLCHSLTFTILSGSTRINRHREIHSQQNYKEKPTLEQRFSF